MAWEMEVDRGSKEYAKLTMNELSFGPLPEAKAAAAESLSRGNRYPERDADPLREAISASNQGITKSHVILGNGSSEVLVDLLQILERPGEVIFPWPSFPFYSSAARVVGLDERVVLAAQEVLEQDFEGEREPFDGRERLCQRRQAIDVDGAAADADLGPRAEAVQCGHDVP